MRLGRKCAGCWRLAHVDACESSAPRWSCPIGRVQSGLFGEVHGSEKFIGQRRDLPFVAPVERRQESADH